MPPRQWTLSISLFAVSLVGTAFGGGPIQPKGVKLENFDYRGVTLDGGRMRMQLDDVRDDYLRIPNDDLLKGFRQRAGLAAPGRILADGTAATSSASSVRSSPGCRGFTRPPANEACREKADALVAEWAKCIAPDGYFYYSAKAQRPALHLRQDGRRPGRRLSVLRQQRSAAHLSRITDWAVKNLDRSQPPRRLRVVHAEREPLSGVSGHRRREIPRLRRGLGVSGISGTSSPDKDDPFGPGPRRQIPRGLSCLQPREHAWAAWARPISLRARPAT